MQKLASIVKKICDSGSASDNTASMSEFFKYADKFIKISSEQSRIILQVPKDVDGDFFILDFKNAQDKKLSEVFFKLFESVINKLTKSMDPKVKEKLGYKLLWAMRQFVSEKYNLTEEDSEKVLESIGSAILGPTG